MVNRLAPFLIVALALAAPAHAALYKCVDVSGKTTYSEVKIANSKCMPVAGEVNVVPAQRPTTPLPPQTAAKPADTRREELTRQIAQQEQALAEAKQQLQEQQDIRLGGERNYQRVLDRLKPYQDKVAELEKQLTDLRAELAKLK